jgi:hypothetical protein
VREPIRLGHVPAQQGAAKLHLALDHEGYLPVFACITDGKSHDIKYTILRENPVPEKGPVMGDHYLEMESTEQPQYRQVLRVATIWDQETQEEMAFLTNHFEFGATTIARILQKALANRTVLQSPQATLAGEGVRGHQRQCPQDPDLDGTDRHADDPAKQRPRYPVLQESHAGDALPTLALHQKIVDLLDFLQIELGPAVVS